MSDKLERVPFPQRTEALRKLNEWLLEGAKRSVRENYPDGLSEEWVEILAHVILDEYGRQMFEKSKAGHQT